MINPRTKGAEGERQLATALNDVINNVLIELGMQLPAKPIVQRNQNQSAVGGKDLVGTYGLAIEVKRQEQLAVNTWWAQCVKSADELNEIPVLIYRQNNKAWNVVIPVALVLPRMNFHNAQPMLHGVRGTIMWTDFLVFFREHVKNSILQETQRNV